MNSRGLTVLFGLLALAVAVWLWSSGGKSPTSGVGSSRSGEPVPGSGETMTGRDRSPPPDVPVPPKSDARLIEQLGDRYFAHHLAKLPPELRKRFLNAIRGRGGFPGRRGRAGDKHYPFTGRLLFEVFPELEE